MFAARNSACRAGAVLFALLVQQLAAQQAWSQATTSGPSVRSGHAMAYDSQRGKVVLFGGLGSFVLGDTWEWDGTSWTQIPVSGPAPRARHTMVYDSQSGVCLLFGGITSVFGQAQDDTWAWDGTMWIQVAFTGPSGRFDHAMAYDSLRGQTVLNGGRQLGVTTPLADTWEWDGGTWSLRSAGPPAVGPGDRGDHSMTFDSLRGRTVLFGGQTGAMTFPTDTWEWDGSAWLLTNTTGPARLGAAMTFDANSGIALLFGGYSSAGFLDDTWQWNGANWNQLAATNPSARGNSASAYDEQNDLTVMFGGQPTQGTEATWLMGASASFTKFGTACPGTQVGVAPYAAANYFGGPLTGAVAPVEYGIVVDLPSQTTLTHFDLFTKSTGGTQTVPAHIYSDVDGSLLASTTMTVGPTAGFYTAIFDPPVETTSNTVLISVDTSAQTVVSPAMSSGTVSPAWTRNLGVGTWQPSPATSQTAWHVHQAVIPVLDHVGLPTLGASYEVTLHDANRLSIAVLVTGDSTSSFGSIPLPILLPATGTCWLQVSPNIAEAFATSAAGTASRTIAVPASQVLAGLELHHQWIVLGAGSPLELIVSDSGTAVLGF